MSKTVVVLLALGIAAFVAGIGHYHHYQATRGSISQSSR